MVLLLTSVCLVSCSGGKLDRAAAERILHNHSATLFHDDVLKIDHATSENYSYAEYGLRPPQGKEPEVEFLDGLVAAGILRKGVEDHRGIDVTYHYEVIPQANVSVLYPNSMNEDVILTMAMPEIKSVTGISQQGADAVVEAQVGLKPTDLYERTLPLVQNTVAKCPSIVPPAIKPYYCAHWPNEAQLASAKTVSINFKKFDDGWRIVDNDQ
jgi:hypothetical protein